MKTIVHLSDVHFGRVDMATVKPLVRAVHEVKPDLVVVSGDLTQRARSHQFKQARVFLEHLPGPQIVVPGNHDVPLWNPLSRFLVPLDKYKRFITKNLYPYYKDEEIAAIGVNTARSFTTKYGRINENQVEKIADRFEPLASDVIKVVVTHHPFELPEGYQNLRQIVGRADYAMKRLAECGADIFLAGHLHTVYTGSTATRYKIEGYSALIVQAGTATSTRVRREPNSFNVIRCDNPNITIERYNWVQQRQQFVLSLAEEFRRTQTGWRRIEDIAI